MYCTSCGAKLPEQAKFCVECGTPVEEHILFTRDAARDSVFFAEEPAEEPFVFAQEPVQQPAYFAAETVSAQYTPRRYRGRLIVAILACFLLFIPTGIPAIVFAAKASRFSKEGREGSARRAARRSTLFSVLSLLCSIVWNVLGLLLLIKKYG